MAYNTKLIENIRAAIKFFPEEFVEKKMFGGIAFLYGGKMTVGAINDNLMVRVLSEKMETNLTKPYVRPMDLTGKAMKEFIFVQHEGYDTQEKLNQWIELGLEHAKFKLNA